jgi:hypothetical protein
VVLCNLSNIDLAMKRRVGTGLMPIIEVHLEAVGLGPTSDFVSATVFLAQFEPVIDVARSGRLTEGKLKRRDIASWPSP